MYKKIIIASGPVIIENKKVLLNQHGDSDFWKFCGGKVEHYNKTLLENAKIKAKEEMGIGIKIINKNPFITHTAKEIDGEKIDVLLVHYLAERIGNVKPGEDIKKWDWISIDKLNRENLAPNIKPVLKYFGFI